MRMSKLDKDVFARAVADEVPIPDQEALVKACQDNIYKLMSPAVRKVFREQPDALKGTRICLADHRCSRKIVVGDVDASEIIEKAEKKGSARIDIRRRIERVIINLNTTKAIEKALPELAHHLPKEGEMTKNLPATNNLIADMIALGWKGGEQ